MQFVRKTELRRPLQLPRRPFVAGGRALVLLSQVVDEPLDLEVDPGSALLLFRRRRPVAGKARGVGVFVALAIGA
jgi:hypothetical protein